MMGGAIHTIFYFAMGIAALLMAFFVVTSKNTLRSVVCLMAVLTISAGFYLLLNAEFLAGVQILVYVGGIVVLMVFAIMLTGVNQQNELLPEPKRKRPAFIASLLFFIVTASILGKANFPVATNTEIPADGIKMIGKSLLDYGPKGYVLPFEVISLLLLAALIGGIVIARKDEQHD